MSLDDTLATLTATARARPDDVALVEGDAALSFARFDAAVDRLAHGIAATGAGPGDVLCWVGPTGIDRTVIVVAANRAGCGTACPHLMGLFVLRHRAEPRQGGPRHRLRSGPRTCRGRAF